MAKKPEIDELSRAILDCLTRRAPLSIARLEDELDLPRRSRRRLREVLNALVHEGRLLRGKTGAFRPAPPVVGRGGRIRVDLRGRASVEDEEGRSHALAPGSGRGCLDGDDVLFRLRRDRQDDGRRRGGRRGRGGRGERERPGRGAEASTASAEILSLRERRRPGAVGRLVRDGAGTWVEPSDPRLPPRFALSGPIPAGTLGRTILGFFDGGAEAERLPELRFGELLGEADAPAALRLEVFLGEGVDWHYPEALTRPAILPDADPRQDARKDLRDLVTVTIDGEDARDFDDALSCRLEEDGGILLHVHVADVARHVPAGSPLDLEARRRGTSIYFPGGVLPMLPPMLSSEACSLLEGQERACLTCELHLDREGRIRRSRLLESLIRSDARLTYDAVEAHLDGGPSLAVALTETLDALAECRRRRKALRRARGGLELFLPRPRCRVGADGSLVAVEADRALVAYEIVEECMLLANETVAHLCRTERLPVPARHHAAPPEEAIADLQELLFTYGVSTRELRLERREEWPRLMAVLSDHPARDALLPLLVRAQARARYAVDETGHFGLALDSYLHFTSPIRRYPDLWTHQILKAWMARDPLPAIGRDEAAERAAACSLLEYRAERIDREIFRRLAARFLAPRTGDAFVGRVVDVRPEGLLLSVEEPFVTGFAPLSALDDDFYVFRREDRSLVGRRRRRSYRLGDRLRLRLVDADPHLGRLDFRPEGHLGRGPE